MDSGFQGVSEAISGGFFRFHFESRGGLGGVLDGFLWGERVVAHYLRGWSGRVVLSSNGVNEELEVNSNRSKISLCSGNRIPLL